MSKSTSANIGFEEKLWLAADKMRNNMDPSEYKNVILGLIFLKYITDTFEATKKIIISESDYYQGLEEDKDAYLAHNAFFVPKEARWQSIMDNAQKPEIGIIIDNAMDAIMKDNHSLRGSLPKTYARSELDKTRLGEIVNLISSIDLTEEAKGKKDILGRIYEYFLGRFASAEGKGGGEFFTPQCVVKLLVSMLEPYSGRIYDPCCGSGGMFVQAEKFIDTHGGKKDDISVFGQEWNPTTYKLCKMNLAIRGINGFLGDHNADSFHNDLHKDLKADFIMANPPFNISDWGGEKLRNDARWMYGVPPVGNANYAWIQHFIYHLSPTGIAGFVMANGSLSSNTSGEGIIRKNLIEKGLVDCIVALPDKLFYTCAIPACLWFVSRDRNNHKFRNRRNEILFIDARKMGTMVSRKNRELTEEDLKKISETYHNWRNINGNYADIKGFCKNAPIEEVEKNDFVLTPGRYVGTEDEVDDGISFDEKMKSLTSELSIQFKQSKELEEKIKENLKKIGYDV